LFDACPPFQIDGNFGITAAIAEMLLQSRVVGSESANPTVEVDLLPALPDAWKSGKISGLRARGGFQVDETWQDGKLISTTIQSTTGEPCSICYGGKTIDLIIKKGDSVTLNGSLTKN
jgi:alpha-L-fucosidase 2